MRLIDADALNGATEYLFETQSSYPPESEWFIKVKDLHSAPTIDAVPVVHGRWKLNRDGSGTCNQCHRTQLDVWDYDRWQNFCGCCGAKMDGEGYGDHESK